MPKKIPKIHKAEEGKALVTADKTTRIELWLPGHSSALYLVIRNYFHNGRSKDETMVRLTPDELDGLIDVLVDGYSLLGDLPEGSTE